MPRHERERRYREQLHVPLRVQREGDVRQQDHEMGTGRATATEREPRDDRQQRADPSKAASGTIRKVHAKSIGENSVHGSDAPDTAAKEIAQFFSGNEIVG